MDFSNVLNNTYTLVLLVLLVLSLLALCLYYGLVWLRVGLYKGSHYPRQVESPAKLPSVSVVIVAHNEAEFLKKSLPYLLEQDYPDYEVVVVDYTSQDDTRFVLHVCSENYPHLKPITFPEDVNMFHGKKYPLSIGIKSATKDIILLTEPECVPKSFSWIREMMESFGKGVDMTLGYSIVQGEKSLTTALQRYEDMVFNASFMGMAMMGNPYTATGRNLSYRREFFFRNGGFISHYSISEGADDLFVNQNADKNNTALALSPDSAVSYNAQETFRMWHRQRLRQRSTRRYYKMRDRLSLTLYPISQYIFLASLVCLFVFNLFPWQLLLSVLILKIIWQTVCSFFLAKRFNVSKIPFFSVFFELYFLIANTILSLFALLRKNKQWR
ncbi:MAG: glycosyltransferase [Bacteroidales bacterium]|nr:glycosyltransferase [Bacteroidales bacterium]